MADIELETILSSGNITDYKKTSYNSTPGVDDSLLNAAEIINGLHDGNIDLISTKDLAVAENIQVEQWNDPNLISGIVHVGQGGVLYATPPAVADTKWTDTSSANVTLDNDTESAAICSVTINEDVDPLGGSFYITYRAQSTGGNKDTTFLTRVYVNGGEIGSTSDVVIPGGSHIVTILTELDLGLSNGDTVSFTVEPDQANAQVNGSIFASVIEITKFAPENVSAQQVYNQAHRVFVSPTNLGAGLSVAEIEAAVTEPIEPLGSFFVTDHQNVFSVILTNSGSYFYERLTKAL